VSVIYEALRLIGGICAIALILGCMVLGAVTAGIIVGLGVWK
jgi:hypothetical protein